MMEILLIAVALAMDCFTVSIVGGVVSGRFCRGNVLRMSFLFGFFQAAMPLIGWFSIHYFKESLEAYDHWIAFGLLSAIGVKMILDSFKGEEEAHIDPHDLKTQILLAFATSIDALAVGISLACTGYESVSSLLLPIIVIGAVSFVLSIVGSFLGVRFGDVVAKYGKPELLGGIILILIGVKILAEHLMW